MKNNIILVINKYFLHLKSRRTKNTIPLDKYIIFSQKKAKGNVIKIIALK